MNEARVPGQQSVRRAIDVLFCFDAGTPDLSAAEVAARLGMNRSTAYRYLQTLAGTGLARDLGDGRFGLGARTVSLADAYTSQWGELEAVAGAALVRLRDAVGETAALHLRQGESRVVVRQVESHHELHRTYRDLGQPISLLSGAPSLAILAALPDDERAAYLDAHADERQRGAVARVLADAGDRGFASTHGSRVPGVASVAAAVRGPAGPVVAAVNVTGPESRLPPSRTAEVARHVTAAAAWIEQRLAGHDNPRPRPTRQLRREP
jgi:DNA-binding IclR family transcriptional regulator